MESYVQHTPNSCGPDAVFFALQNLLPRMTYEELKELWDWQDYSDIRVDFQDTPLNHFDILQKISMKFELITLKRFLSGDIIPNQTIFLWHFKENPLLYQHWMVVKEVTPQYIVFHAGDGTIRHKTVQEVIAGYRDGTPACVYVIGRGKTFLRWYEIWLVRIMDFLF